MKLYVGNLPFSATEDEIRSLFDNFGGAVDLHIPLDRETGRCHQTCTSIPGSARKNLDLDNSSERFCVFSRMQYQLSQ